MDYTVVIEKADDGSYSGYVPDLPGCVSCGDTPGQALDSIREAIQGHGNQRTVGDHSDS